MLSAKTIPNHLVSSQHVSYFFVPGGHIARQHCFGKERPSEVGVCVCVFEVTLIACFNGQAKENHHL